MTEDGEDPFGLTAEFAPTESEWAKVYRWLFFRSRSFTGLVLAVVVLAVAWLVSRDGAFGAIVIAELGVLGYYLLVKGRLQWRRDPAVRQPRTLTITHDGLRTETATTTSQIAWSGIRGVRRDANLYFFMTARSCAIPLPVRALSPDDATALDRFVTTQSLG